MAISLSLSRSETLTPSILRGVVVDDRDGGVHGAVKIRRAPVALERRVEHVAEPVDDHRLAHLAEDAAVDLGVVVRRAGEPGERARGHQDDAPADRLDGRDLLLIGAGHVVDAPGVGRIEVIGAGAGEHDRAVAALRGGDRALDQLQRHRPVEPHAALRRIHRLGDAEPEVPEMLAEGDGALPVGRHRKPGIDLGERVDDHVGGGKRNAVQRPRHALGEVLGDRQVEALEPARRRPADAARGP